MPPSSSLPPEDRALVDRVAIIGLALFLTGQAAAGQTESDIWGHMAIGLDTIAAGHLLRVDPYSFTHDIPWVNHEWLWDIVTAALYQSTGLPGLLALRVLLIGAVLWVAVLATRRMPTWARAVALVALAIVSSAQWHNTRPQLATMPLYAIVLLRPNAWWLPALFALWANVHGGWMIGVAALAAFTLMHRGRRQFIVLAASTLATLANPYGVRLWLSLAEAISRGWDDVSEWAPIWSRPAGLAPLWIWLVAAALVVAAWRYVQADRWEWGWTIVTFAAAAQSRRLMGLAALTAVLLLLPSWRAAGLEAVRPHWTAARKAVAAAALAGSTALALSFVVPTARCFPPAPRWHAPEPDSVAFVRDAGLTGRALVYFDFGEYVIYHLRDRLKVSIDNRRETVYSDDVVQAHLRFYDGKDPGYPDRLAADLVWLPRSLDPVAATLQSRGWHRRFVGPRTMILTRTAGPTVEGHDALGTPCFPYP